ncbi:MAG: hypothetical protein ACYC4L_02955 [Chloroflexota bacterium]
MKYTTRELVYVGLFGALWGMVELSLGSYLHVLGIPFNGTILAAAGITIALASRTLVPRRGSVLFIGAVTAALKMFSLGGIVLNPMLAILIESGLAELGLLPSRLPRRWTFVLAAVLAVSWDFGHRFFTQALLGGRGVLEVYRWVIQDGSRIIGLGEGSALAVLAFLLGLRVVVGVGAGLVAWSVGTAVRRRLGAPATAVQQSAS